MSDSIHDAPPAGKFWVAAIGVLGTFLIFGVIVLVAYLQPRWAAEEATADLLQKVEEADRWRFTPEGRAARLSEVNGRAQQELRSYGWVDQGKGVVRLPIDRAMDLVVEEKRAGQK